MYLYTYICHQEASIPYSIVKLQEIVSDMKVPSVSALQDRTGYWGCSWVKQEIKYDGLELFVSCCMLVNHLWVPLSSWMCHGAKGSQWVWVWPHYTERSVQWSWAIFYFFTITKIKELWTWMLHIQYNTIASRPIRKCKDGNSSMFSIDDSQGYLLFLPNCNYHEHATMCCFYTDCP